MGSQSEPGPFEHQMVHPHHEDRRVERHVTGDELDENVSGTLDCDTVGGEVVTPDPLPQTGANTIGLLSLAGALLLVGWACITGARRREARVS